MCASFPVPQITISKVEDPFEGLERPMLTYLEKSKIKGPKRRRSRKEEDIENILAKQDIKKRDERLTVFIERIKERRNAVCEVLMPRNYFIDLSHLELLNVLKLSDLI